MPTRDFCQPRVFFPCQSTSLEKKNIPSTLYSLQRRGKTFLLLILPYSSSLSTTARLILHYYYPYSPTQLLILHKQSNEIRNMNRKSNRCGIIVAQVASILIRFTSAIFFTSTEVSSFTTFIIAGLSTAVLITLMNRNSSYTFSHYHKDMDHYDQ